MHLTQTPTPYSYARACGVPDADEILQALRHLQSFNFKMTAVEEVVDPLPATPAWTTHKQQLT